MSGVENTMGRFQPTEGGFILEGEVRATPVVEGAACSVCGVEPSESYHTAQRSLLEVLKRFEGRNVRITVEVVERCPADALRDVVERFRQECEEPEENSNSFYPAVG
jgi:hypothetical protein